MQCASLAYGEGCPCTYIRTMDLGYLKYLYKAWFIFHWLQQIDNLSLTNILFPFQACAVTTDYSLVLTLVQLAIPRRQNDAIPLFILQRFNNTTDSLQANHGNCYHIIRAIGNQSNLCPPRRMLIQDFRHVSLLARPFSFAWSLKHEKICFCSGNIPLMTTLTLNEAHHA